MCILENKDFWKDIGVVSILKVAQYSDLVIGCQNILTFYCIFEALVKRRTKGIKELHKSTIVGATGDMLTTKVRKLTYFGITIYFVKNVYLRMNGHFLEGNSFHCFGKIVTFGGCLSL